MELSELFTTQGITVTIFLLTTKCKILIILSCLKKKNSVSKFFTRISFDRYTK